VAIKSTSLDPRLGNQARALHSIAVMLKTKVPTCIILTNCKFEYRVILNMSVDFTFITRATLAIARVLAVVTVCLSVCM